MKSQPRGLWAGRLKTKDWWGYLLNKSAHQRQVGNSWKHSTDEKGARGDDIKDTGDGNDRDSRIGWMLIPGPRMEGWQKDWMRITGRGCDWIYRWMSYWICDYWCCFIRYPTVPDRISSWEIRKTCSISISGSRSGNGTKRAAQTKVPAAKESLFLQEERILVSLQSYIQMQQERGMHVL